MVKSFVDGKAPRNIPVGDAPTLAGNLRKLKVEVFHNVMWSKYKGGVFGQLYRQAQSEGMEIHFIHIAETERSRKALSDVDLSYHKYPYELMFHGGYEDIPKFLMVLRTFGRVFSSRADLVVLPGYDKLEYWGMLAAAVLRGKKRATFCDSTAYDREQTLLKSLLKRFFFRRCHGFFAYGSRSGEYLGMHGVRAAQIYTRCQAAALPQDYAPEQALARRLEYLSMAREPRLLYVGRLAAEKRIDTLLEAFSIIRREFPAAVLVIVGAGPMKEALQTIALTLKITSGVMWLGSMGSDGLENEYASATCLVLPSSSEPWGLVANEALSYGCPVIVSDRCGCSPELIVDGVTGFSFVTGDANDLASRIRSAISSFARNTQSAVACIEHMRNFTPAIAGFQMLMGCRKILDS